VKSKENLYTITRESMRLSSPKSCSRCSCITHSLLESTAWSRASAKTWRRRLS